MHRVVLDSDSGKCKISPSQSEELLLSGAEFQHLCQVRRARVGEHVEVLDPEKQRIYFTKILAIKQHHCVLSVLGQRVTHSVRPVMLFCAAVKPDKCVLIVEKCTELSVQQIVFFDAQYSQHGYFAQEPEKKLERLKRKAFSAAKQSGFSSLPNLAFAKSLQDALLPLSQLEDGENRPSLRLLCSASRELNPLSFYSIPAVQKLLCSFWGIGKTLEPNEKPAESIFIVGPEGGLTWAEETAAVNRGFIPLSLGQKTLRTETAAIHCAGILGQLLSLGTSAES